MRRIINTKLTLFTGILARLEPLPKKKLNGTGKTKNKLWISCTLLLLLSLLFRAHLIELFGCTAVKHQYPVDLLPPGRCHPKGKKWTIDFAIRPDKQFKRSLMLVEAKGYPTDTFLTNLSILEATNPNLFKSLFLIFERNIPDNRMIANLRKTNIGAKVLTLQEFVERNSLTLI